MSLRIIRSPSFRDLLSRLLQEIRKECERDPFAPKWVLTPTAVLAARLRLQIARSAETVRTGVHVVPLPHLVHRLCGELCGGRPIRWDPFLDALLLRFVAAAQENDAFPGLRAADDGHTLLVPAFMDLAEAGFGPDQAGLLREIVEEGGIDRTAVSTLGLYTTWLESLEQIDYPWAPRLQLQLGERLAETGEQDLLPLLSAEAGQGTRLFVYGFYDFTDLNLETIGALSRMVPVTVLLPGVDEKERGASSFRMTADLVEELERRAGCCEVETLPSGDRSTRFFLETFPEGELSSQPGFLSFQKVSGIHAEALAAAVRARHWLDTQPGLMPEEILLIVPDLGSYYAPLSVAFQDFRLPLQFPGMEQDPPAAHLPLIGLQQLLATGAAGEWLLDYFREYPDVARRFLSDPLRFEWKLRKVGFPGGPAAWRGLRELLRKDRSRAETAVGGFAEDELDLIDAIIDLWVVDSPNRRAMSGDAARNWLDRAARWLPEPDLLLPVIDSLEQVAEGSDRDDFTPASLLRLALRTIGTNDSTTASTDSAIQVLPYMKARGMTCRGLIFLGLSSDNFPRRIEEDSLLPDAVRSRIVGKARILGHRLPVKSEAVREMALLFSVLNTSAEMVHWVIPESDSHGRAVAPSPFVLRYLNRWGSEESSRLFSARVPRSPLQQADWLYTLDPRGGAFLPPGVLDWWAPFRLAPEKVPPRAAGRGRGRAPERNGWIGQGIFNASDPPFRLRVTSLEKLAKCPFRFWAGEIAELAPLALISWQGDVNPMERGSLVHAILAELVHRHPGETLGEIARRYPPETGLEPALEPLPPAFLRIALLPESVRRSILRDAVSLILGYLDAVNQGSCADALPVATEEVIRAGIPGMPGFLVSGIVDRIDQRNGTAWIVDYKSSRSPFSTRQQPDEAQEIECGFMLQAHLYPWLVENQRGETVRGFSYVYLGQVPPVEAHFTNIPEAGGVFRQVEPILEQGLFVPTSDEVYEELGRDGLQPCGFCEFASLCRRFDPFSKEVVIDLLRTAAPARYEVLSGVPGKGEPDGDH